jgi:hypothetical protein
MSVPRAVSGQFARHHGYRVDELIEIIEDVG